MRWFYEYHDTVSEKTEQIIREMAKESGKDVSQFVGEFLEENFTNGQKNGSEQSKLQEIKTERRYMRMKGMFSSGKTDTSERMHEILQSEDFDPSEGFSIR